MQKHQSSKPGTPGPIPSKTLIIGWLKSIFPDLPVNAKIEDFGDGVIYCRLLNHYYLNPPHSKITWLPKNQYQYINNLKHAQTALLQLGIVIPFDVNRVCKRKFLQNWALINCFYKHFVLGEEISHQQNSNSSHGLQAQTQIQSHSVYPQNHNVSITFPTHPIQNIPQRQLKRMQPVHSHNEIEQSNHLKHVGLGFTQGIGAHPGWDQNYSMQISQLAHNSLQLSQYMKQNVNIYNGNSIGSPNKGKWSVGSQMFQNNQHAVIDRVKQILLKGLHDTQKVRQIKMLLGIPIQEQEIIKIQDDEANGHVVFNHPQVKIEEKKQPNPQQLKQFKQIVDVLHKETSSNNFKQQKLSVSKSGKKPFKI